MKLIHKLNHKKWDYNIWHDTQDTQSYLGDHSGTQQRTITLTHNIIKPVIKNKPLILRAHYNLQINFLTKTNATKTQHEEFLSK